jgi:hypothetical protein
MTVTYNLHNVLNWKTDIGKLWQRFAFFVVVPIWSIEKKNVGQLFRSGKKSIDNRAIFVKILWGNGR